MMSARMGPTVSSGSGRSDDDPTQTDYWNHNVHYQPVILNAVPGGCGAALEVGCGDGLLARRLAARGRRGDRDRRATRG